MSVDDGYNTLNSIKNSNFTAIFTANDKLAIEAMIAFNPCSRDPMRYVNTFERKVGGAELNLAIGCGQALSSSVSNLKLKVIAVTFKVYTPLTKDVIVLNNEVFDGLSNPV